MAVTASGMLSLPLSNAKTALAACQAFQAWCGVTGEDLGQAAGIAVAVAHLHLGEYQDPAEQDYATDALWLAARLAGMPVCVIGFGDDLAAEEVDSGSRWEVTGGLYASFEEQSQNETGVETGENAVSNIDAVLHLTNAVGAILVELAALVAGGGYIDLVGWTLRENPGREALECRGGVMVDRTQMSVNFQRRDM